MHDTTSVLKTMVSKRKKERKRGWEERKRERNMSDIHGRLGMWIERVPEEIHGGK